MLDQIASMGLSAALGAAMPAIEVISKISPTAFQLLRDYFHQSPHILGEAWSDAYQRGASTIAASIAQPTVWDRFKKAFRSNLNASFQQKIKENFVETYRKTYNCSPEQMAALQETAALCLLSLADNVSALYPKERWKEEDIASVLSKKTSELALSALLVEEAITFAEQKQILAQEASTKAITRKDLTQFFSHQQMLLSAAMLFFREKLLSDPRLREATDLLQKENILQRLESLQAQQQQNLAEQQQQKQAIEALLENSNSQKAALAQLLESQEAQKNEIASSLKKREQEREALHAMLQQLESRLASIQSEIVQKAQAGDFSALGQLTQDANALKQQTTEQQSALDTINAQLLEQKALFQSLDTEIKGIQQQQKELQQTLQENKKQLQALNAQIKEINKDTQEIKAALKSQNKEISRFGTRLDELGEQMGDMRELIKLEANALREAIQDGLDEIRIRLQGLEREIRELKEQIQELLAIMRGQGLEPRTVTISHELTLHPSANQKTIREVYERLRKLPREKLADYTEMSIKVGTALSSMGALEEAKNCFLSAREEAEKSFNAAKDEKARQDWSEKLATLHHNLHQIFLREGAYTPSLDSLQQAVALDRARYTPFNMENYQVKRILGAGGMGCAFLCEEILSRQMVVVKTFWDARQGKLHEVFGEAFRMNQADPQGEFAPKALHIGYADSSKQERPYVVMEYIAESMDGEQYLQQHGPMSWREGVRIALLAAQALARAHAQGICHLDLKPANLLFYKKGREWAIKIIDFGLARAARSLHKEIASQKSRSQRSVLMNAAFGTLHYAPPEQLNPTPSQQPDAPSDIFSFAKTIYRLTTGQEAQNILPHPALSQSPLWPLLIECLHYDMSKRPTASDLIERLQKIGEEDCPWWPSYLRDIAQQRMADGILREADEVLLWTLIRGAGHSVENGLDCFRWSFRRIPARRQSAIRAESWLKEQKPAYYAQQIIWSALCEKHPRDYTDRGFREIPQLQINDVFADDPAFVVEEHGVRLEIWTPPFVGDAPVSEEIIEIQAGQLAAQLTWFHRLWLEIRNEEGGSPLRDTEYLRLPLGRYRQLSEEKIIASKKVANALQQLKQQSGLHFALCAPDGQPAEKNEKTVLYKLTGSNLAFVRGNAIFFNLRPSKQATSIWKNKGRLVSKHLTEPEFASLSDHLILLSERGESPARLDKSKGHLEDLHGFWKLYPEAADEDALFLHPLDTQRCRVYLISQAALSDRPLSQNAPPIVIVEEPTKKKKSAPKKSSQPSKSNETLAAKKQETPSDTQETLMAVTPSFRHDETSAISDLIEQSGLPAQEERTDADLPTLALPEGVNPFATALSESESVATLSQSEIVLTLDEDDILESDEEDEDITTLDMDLTESASVAASSNEEDTSPPTVAFPPQSADAKDEATEKKKTKKTKKTKEIAKLPLSPENEDVQAPALPLELEGDSDTPHAQKGLTVRRRQLDWIADYGLWIEILDPKTNEAADPERPIEEIRHKPPKPKEVNPSGHNTVQNFLKRLQLATGLKLRLLDLDGKPVQDLSHRLGNYWLPRSAWSKAAGKDVLITLKPAPAMGDSPSWRKYGYLSLGNIGKSVLSDEDHGRTVTLETEEGKSFSMRLCASPPRFEQLSAFFRDASDLTAGDILAFLRVAEDRFRLYTLTREEIFPAAKPDPQDTGGHASFSPTMEEEDAEPTTLSLAPQDTTLNASTQGTAFNAPLQEGNAEKTAPLSHPEIALALLQEADQALDAGRHPQALDLYARLYQDAMNALESHPAAIQRISAAMQFTKALEFEQEGNIEQTLRLLDAVSVLDPSFLVQELVEKKQTLHQELQQKLRNRFTRMSREAVQLAQTEPETALRMLLAAQELMPSLWSQRHQEWADYLRAVVKTA